LYFCKIIPERENSMEHGIYEDFVDLSLQLRFVPVKNSECILHFHENIEIVYVLNGEIEYVNNTEKQTLLPGEVIFLPPYFSHAFHSHKETDSAAVVIPSKYLADYNREFSDLNFTKMTNREYNQQIYTLMQAIAEDTPETPELVRIGWVNLLLGYIIMHYPSHPYNKNDILMKNIALYVNDHYTEKLTLEKIAHCFGYNPSYFSRMFRSLFNISFTDYVNNVRCAYIRKNLKEHSITELIYKAGFNSTSSYYRFLQKNAYRE